MWNDFTTGIDEDDRVWWDAPLIYHPSNPDEMWTGSQRVYRMQNAPVSVWQAVSEDLTYAESPGLSYRCVSALAGSHFSEDIVAAGTTDGRVWITQDHGATWNPMETGLPGQFITDIEFDPYHPDSMFCTVSGYRNAVYTPFVFRAAIGGDWQSIQGDLPEHPVNQIMPLNDSIWTVATDAGVFATLNWGANWEPVGNLPTIPVYDIDADTITDRLIAGTFARSMMSFPLDSIMPAEEVIEPNAVTEAGAIELNVFPNPFDASLSVAWPEGTHRVVIFDMAGRQVFEHMGLLPLSQPINTSEWPAGSYVVRTEGTFGSRTQQAIKLR